MTAGSSPASYPTPTTTTFSTCLGCHGTGSTYGAFSFDEAWSEDSDDTVFDYYCPNWNSNPNASYYGARRGGCLLRLVDLGTMPQGSPGTWIYQDEYLQWYCSSSGPGGGLFGF